MKITSAILFVTMGCFGSGAIAQTAPAADTEQTVELIRLSNGAGDLELINELHQVVDNKTVITGNRAQNTLLVKGTADQLLLVRRVVQDLDRPQKTYRATYTITESDQGKRLGVQHFAMVVVSGQKTSLKEGSKVPVATGSSTTGGGSSQTQFTYLDVGINLDATVDESPNGVRLRSKTEQSSVAESAIGPQDPVVRQTVLEGTSIITLGKPLVLGSLDIPGSTRHLDIEATVDLVK